MSGFLDRLAARAVGDVGETPLVHPRVRSRFEPGGGEVVEASGEVGEVGEERVAVERVVEGSPLVAGRIEGVSVAHRAESSPPQPPLPSPNPPNPGRGGATAKNQEEQEESGFPLSRRGVGGRWERGLGGEDSARRAADPHETLSEPSHGRVEHTPGPSPTPVLERAVAPPLPRGGSADGRGGRGVRVHKAPAPEEPVQATNRPEEPPRSEERSIPSRDQTRLVPAEPASPVRRDTPSAELPTVEAHRGAPLPEPAASAESEPSETVVQVTIGRIDVRAVPPPAPARRAERPAGPRLSLTDYLRRRGEGRR